MGRGAHFEKIKKDGLFIHGIWGEHHIKKLRAFSCPKEISKPCSIILLSVKSFDTAEAIKKTASLLAEDGLVVSLQNGLGNLEEIADQVGTKHTIGGRVIFGVEIPQPGEAKVTVYADKVLLGAMEGAEGSKGINDKIKGNILAL